MADVNDVLFISWSSCSSSIRPALYVLAKCAPSSTPYLDPLLRIEVDIAPGIGDALFDISPAKERPCRCALSSSSCSLADVRRLAGMLLAPAAREKGCELPLATTSGERLTEGAYVTDFRFSDEETPSELRNWDLMLKCSLGNVALSRGGVVGADTARCCMPEEPLIGEPLPVYGISRSS